MSDKWAPNSTPCTPMWWADWGCFNRPHCAPCSWTVPPDLPQAVSAPLNPYYPFAPYAPPYPQYGFQDCNCGPPPPPYPAPYQMPPNAPAAPLYRRPCPMIYVGHGACCDECAVGKPCAGAAACCDECAAGQPCSCKGAGPVPVPVLASVAGASAARQIMVGAPHAMVGALYVSDAELDALGTQIALMGGDVDVAAKATDDYAKTFASNEAGDACKFAGLKWDAAGNKCLNEPDPTGASYSVFTVDPATGMRPLRRFAGERWTPFQLKWNAYRDETFHAPTDYDVLRTEFATIVDEWKSLGQTTRASVPAPLSESSGSNAIPWTWIAIGVGVLGLTVIPFLIPVLTGTYLAVTKGKSLGLTPPAAA